MAEEQKKPDAVAFCKAATDGDLPALRRIAADGGRDLIRNSNAIVDAARHGNTDCLRWLLEQGADVNRENSGQSTALIWAAFGGYKDAVALLIGNGASPTHKSDTGKSAIDYARDAGHTAVLALLVRDPDEVSWYTAVDNRAMQDVFNFRLKERITLIRKSEGGDVEAVTRQSFSSLDDTSALRKAFDEYRGRGGKIGEDEVFEGTLAKPRHLPKPGGGA